MSCKLACCLISVIVRINEQMRLLSLYFFSHRIDRLLHRKSGLAETLNVIVHLFCIIYSLSRSCFVLFSELYLLVSVSDTFCQKICSTHFSYLQVPIETAIAILSHCISTEATTPDAQMRLDRSDGTRALFMSTDDLEVKHSKISFGFKSFG